MQFRVPEVLYMGNFISAQGLRPDDTNVKAITSMPDPEDRPALQRLLGMVKYLTKYIPNESEITAPLRHLRTYVFGKKVHVQTDHRPLEAIFRKPLGSATPRLQRILLGLQRYELDVNYVPGKYMYMADTLSLVYLPGTPKQDDIQEEMVVHSIA